MVVRVTARHAAAGREARRLKRALEKMTVRLALGRDFELSVSLVSDEEIEALNREYLGKDEPTDVLSFPQMSPDEIEKLQPGRGSEPELLGDIVISVQTARRQASDGGHSLRAELEALGAHGLLHLFGYGHSNSEDAARMTEAEIALAGKSMIGEGMGD